MVDIKRAQCSNPEIAIFGLELQFSRNFRENATRFTAVHTCVVKQAF